MMKSPNSAIILHSGGLDSTVCLLLAKEKGLSVLSLGIDYRQYHRIELEYAAAQCRKYGVQRRVLHVEWDRERLETPKNRSVESMKKNISPAFLPTRNVLFLTLACAEAAGLKANEVWIGVNAIDYSGYPDCTPQFIQAYKSMLISAGVKKINIVTPLINMSKPEIAKEACRLGLAQGDTWSCYQPQFSSSGILPCGQCDACILHNYAWREGSIEDPVI